ncbi:MAG TPA: hypothetical protein VHX39_04365 [Acetobacteraceae bacterium]|nr:hypothetical protein [Acetobacteraceae bacterium]
MDEPRAADSKPRLRRTIVLCAIFVTASALGMVLARPVAAQFLHSSPWILPAIAVGMLLILVIVALLVLPRLTMRQP